jgi:hypothetical protein
MSIRAGIRGAAAKIIGKDSEHISRFHSRRGELCNMADVAAVPRIVWRRLVRTRAVSPWVVPAATKFVDLMLKPSDVLLELGSGSSTVWYARRVEHVLSLENDSEWARRVALQLAEQPNAEVRHCVLGESFAGALQELRPTILIVDHTDSPIFSRNDAIRMALQVPNCLRSIVLDDSDRLGYHPAFSLLEDWSAHRFVGFRDNPLRLTETTVFVKKTE